MEVRYSFPLPGVEVISQRTEGKYWSSKLWKQFDGNAYCLSFSETGEETKAQARAIGFSVRPVQN